jgi:hypothetical protein
LVPSGHPTSFRTPIQRAAAPVRHVGERVPQLTCLLEPAGGDQREAEPAACLDGHSLDCLAYRGGHLVDARTGVLGHRDREGQMQIAGLATVPADVARPVGQSRRLREVATPEVVGGAGQQE